jgi:hypothetical protein
MARRESRRSSPLRPDRGDRRGDEPLTAEEGQDGLRPSEAIWLPPGVVRAAGGLLWGAAMVVSSGVAVLSRLVDAPPILIEDLLAATGRRKTRRARPRRTDLTRSCTGSG